VPLLAVKPSAPYKASVHAVSVLACTQDGPWWVGWVEEVPGVNAQERSRDALLASRSVAPPAATRLLPLAGGKQSFVVASPGDLSPQRTSLAKLAKFAVDARAGQHAQCQEPVVAARQGGPGR